MAGKVEDATASMIRNLEDKTGKSMAEARERVYAHVARVYFPGAMYRTDIALREVV